jgi:protein prenyltransferase alpha subunit repeat containing protein 1
MEVGMEMEDIYHEILRVWKEEAVVEIEFAPILSPPFVLYAEKTLALSMKILKPLYLYVYQKFLDECKQYRQTIQANGCALTNTTMTEVLMNSSLVLLTVKADFPMAYNIRKEILQFCPEMERFGQEIQCLHVLFSRHPKSPSAWQHVRWCYSQRHALRSTLASTSTSTRIAIAKQDNQHEVLLLGNELESEREICRRSAEKYPKNYYAWMHRLWLLPQMTFLQVFCFADGISKYPIAGPICTCYYENYLVCFIAGRRTML